MQPRPPHHTSTQWTDLRTYGPTSHLKFPNKMENHLTFKPRKIDGKISDRILRTDFTLVFRPCVCACVCACVHVCASACIRVQCVLDCFVFLRLPSPQLKPIIQNWLTYKLHSRKELNKAGYRTNRCGYCWAGAAQAASRLFQGFPNITSNHKFRWCLQTCHGPTEG